MKTDENKTDIKIYELGSNGKLNPLTLSEENNNLTIGQVIQWGGNMAWPAEKFAIYKIGELSRYGRGRRYDLISLEKPAHILITDALELKRKEDKDVWHSQHLFILDEKADPEEVLRFGKDAELIRSENEKAAAAARIQFEEEQKRIDIGDIYHTSWGYSMTINEFIKVVGFTSSKKSAICQSMTHITEGDPGVQSPNEVLGPKFKMKIEEYNGKKELRGTYYHTDGEKGSLESFHKWDGKPKYYNTWD